MPTNRRVIYATHAVGIAPLSATGTAYTSIHGLQSAGVNTNYTLENIQELGQLAIYQLVEQIPEIEATLEKVLDGYPLMYHLATQGVVDGSMIGRSNAQCMLALSVYGDTQTASSGTPTSQIECSGMWWSQSSFTFGTDRPFTESLTLVGNNKVNKSSLPDYLAAFTNTDAPFAAVGSGGVQLRRDMIFYPILAAADPNFGKETSTALDVNNQLNAFLTILPPDITGISSSGTNFIQASTSDFNAHIQSITVSINAGRDSILELGRKFPYFRFVNFPVAVTTEVTVIASDCDLLAASEAGLDGQGNNTVNRTIKLRAREGTWIDLGTHNKCQSVSFTGGNADGGNVTTTYSFITYNDYLIAHPNDPSNGVGSVKWPF